VYDYKKGIFASKIVKSTHFSEKMLKCVTLTFESDRGALVFDSLWYFSRDQH